MAAYEPCLNYRRGAPNAERDKVHTVRLAARRQRGAQSAGCLCCSCGLARTRQLKLAAAASPR
jgi:hypothetical protein